MAFYWPGFFLNILKIKVRANKYPIADFDGTSSTVSQVSIMLNVYLRTTLGLALY